MSALRDKVWITGRTRMLAEARLRRQGALWNLLIVWYSVALTCLSVYQLIAENDAQRNLAATILSILVLSLSIYIPTLGFEQKADQYRSCYLRLQRLLDSTSENDPIATKYHDILDHFPNHPTKDWLSLLVSSERDGNPIHSGGKVVPITGEMRISHYLRNFSVFTCWIAAFFVPVALYLWLLR